MIKWEYDVMMVSKNDPLASVSLLLPMNEMGAKGWELVQVMFGSETLVFFFKRELK